MGAIGSEANGDEGGRLGLLNVDLKVVVEAGGNRNVRLDKDLVGTTTAATRASASGEGEEAATATASSGGSAGVLDRATLSTVEDDTELLGVDAEARCEQVSLVGDGQVREHRRHGELNGRLARGGVGVPELAAQVGPGARQLLLAATGGALLGQSEERLEDGSLVALERGGSGREREHVLESLKGAGLELSMEPGVERRALELARGGAVGGREERAKEGGERFGQETGSKLNLSNGDEERDSDLAHVGLALVEDDLGLLADAGVEGDDGALALGRSMGIANLDAATNANGFSEAAEETEEEEGLADAHGLDVGGEDWARRQGARKLGDVGRHGDQALKDERGPVSRGALRVGQGTNERNVLGGEGGSGVAVAPEDRPVARLLLVGIGGGRLLGVLGGALDESDRRALEGKSRSEARALLTGTSAEQSRAVRVDLLEERLHLALGVGASLEEVGAPGAAADLDELLFAQRPGVEEESDVGLVVALIARLFSLLGGARRRGGRRGARRALLVLGSEEPARGLGQQELEELGGIGRRLEGQHAPHEAKNETLRARSSVGAKEGEEARRVRKGEEE